MKGKKKIISEKPKKPMKTIKAVRFCPICKSTNIAPYAGFVSASYKCKNCGYVGNFFLEKYKKSKK